MQLDPAAGVDEQRERQRVRLGEAEVREGLDLRVDRVAGLLAQAVPGHPRIERVPDPVDAFETALGSHRTAQQVGVFCSAVADHHRHLHQLLLEDGDAERAAQHGLEGGMRVGHRVAPHLAAHERMHGTALDGAGPDQRDLDREVVEAARLQPGEQTHLRAGLDLEHPDRSRRGRACRRRRAPHGGCRPIATSRPWRPG